MSVLNNTSSILYFVCVLLMLPSAVCFTILLCFGRGRVPKGLWITVCALNLLGCAGLATLDLVVRVSSFSNPAEVIFPMLKQILLPTLCYMAALIFPMAATMGRKGGWKPLLLLPALLTCLLSPVFRTGAVSVKIILLMTLIHAPLTLMLVLMPAWYYAGKKTWLGAMVALVGAGVLLTMPLLSATVGMSLMYMTGIGEIFDTIGMLFRGTAQRGVQFLLSPLRSGGFPLAAYALVVQLTIMGLHSKRLPKEGMLTGMTPPPAKKYCMGCGCELPVGQKFCTKCGKEA